MLDVSVLVLYTKNLVTVHGTNDVRNKDRLDFF